MKLLRFRWRNAPIGIKFTLLVTIFLLIILFLAVNGIVSLNMIQERMSARIITSTDIRHLALRMEAEMLRSRQLDRDFFLRWPETGYTRAYSTYAYENLHNIAALMETSRHLRDLIMASEVSQSMQNNITNLNFYLSAADRYAQAFDEAITLVALLGREETGLQPELSRLSRHIKTRLEQTAGPTLKLMFSQVRTLEKEYLMTRQRPFMQSAFNLLAEFRQELAATRYFSDPSFLNEIENLLTRYVFTAEAILNLDREIRSKLNEFDLQMAALAPVSSQLVAVADAEVAHARQVIEQTGRRARAVLVSGLIIALLTLGLLTLAIRRSITSKLSDLSRVAEQLRQGNLNTRAVVTSNDEIGRLAGTLNSMATQMAELMAALRFRVNMADTRLFQAIEAVSEGFLLFDDRDTLVLANQNSQRLLSGLEDLIDTGTGLPGLIQAARHRSLFHNFTASADPDHTFLSRLSGPYQLHHVDGRWLKIQFSKTVDDETVCIVEDITNAKQAEQERLEMERQLLHAQKLESLGILAGGIAHDFNNLLAAMLGNLELAGLKLPADSEVHNYIKRVETAVRQAAHLTRQMLDYSGKGRSYLAPLNINALIQTHLEMFRTVIPRNITMDVALADDLPAVVADAGQIQQVVMNLITNAAEAIGEQAGQITLNTAVVDCEQGELNESRSAVKPSPGRFVRLTVTDTGQGMDADTQNRLFEPFFTTKFTGRGLGMAATLGIIRGHGGAIMVNSAAGQGTSIQVLFPVSSLPEAVGSETPAVPENLLKAPGPSESHSAALVLVVDDEPFVREFCVEALAQMGYATLTAADGIEAVELFQQRAKDITCVLLDLTMPRQGGVETFKALQGIKPGVPVIISSGFSSDKVETRFLDPRPRGFLQKPFQFSRLQDELQRAHGAP